MHKVKKLISSLCFIIILCIVLNSVSFLFERKEGAQRYSVFWENPKEYDVWFIGNSHIINSIHPMELWEQQGIRSYVLAAPNSYLPQTYWTLMCALQYSQPQIIVLDPYKIQEDDKHQKAKSRVHTGFDSIPFSMTKLQGICDIFDTWEDRFEHICKFSVYHNRWEDLTQEDFDFQPAATKGSRLRHEIRDQSGYQKVIDNSVASTDTLGFSYLQKIIDECGKRGIELLLVEIPYAESEAAHSTMNAVAEMADKNGLTFLRLYNENLIDYSVDCADNSHVNMFGSKKVTRYMGEYLTQHYDLSDYRDTKEVAEKWNADYESYLQFKVEEMNKTEEIKTYVLWLSDDRYVCYIYQKKEPDDLLKREIAQLKDVTYISLEEAEERMGEEVDGEYAFFVENGSGEILDKAVFKKGKRQ